MRKFVVGERYEVGGKCDETGNTIEITRVGSSRCMYKTIKGKAPEPWAESFDKESSFAKNLTLFTGEEKVVILRSGNTVTATQYADGKKRGTGVAKCSPEDSFDFAFGAKLALERLFGETESATETRFDWVAFGDGEISVRVNRETIGDFLQHCEEQGFEWKSGKQAKNFNPFASYDDFDEFTQELICSQNCEPKENIWISMCEGNLCFETDAPETEVFVWKKPFDWEGFKSGKFSVKLTEKDSKSFLEEAEKNGCKWRSGKKPTQFIPNKKAFWLECSATEYGLLSWERADYYDLVIAKRRHFSHTKNNTERK